MQAIDETRASNRATVIVGNCPRQIIMREVLHEQLKSEGFIPENVSLGDITFGRIVTMAKLRRVNADGTQFDRSLQEKNNPSNDGGCYTFSALVVTKPKTKVSKQKTNNKPQTRQHPKPDPKVAKVLATDGSGPGIGVDVTNDEVVVIGNSRFSKVKRVILYFTITLVVVGLSRMSFLALKSMGS